MSRSYLRTQLSVNNSALNEKYGLIFYPPKLEFENVVPNESLTSVISIQNASSHIKKIRIIGISEQHRNFFQIHTDHAYQDLAAGCSMDIPVTYCTSGPLVQSLYTELRVGVKDRMIGGEVTVETIVRIPSSKLEFESMLDFGTMVARNTMTKCLRVTNSGTKKGSFKLEIPNKHKSEIVIKPKMEGELEEGEFVDLEITLKAPDRLGIYRCLVNVIQDNDQNDMKTLDIISNICHDPGITFIMPKTKAAIERIDFGHLYCGQQRSFKGLLVNNGPKPAHYSLYLKPNKNWKQNQNKNNITNTHYATDNEEEHTETEETEDTENIGDDGNDGGAGGGDRNNKDENSGFDEDAQPIKMDHEEGTLAPYESKMITILYVPEIQQRLKGFTTTYKPKQDISKMRLLLVIESGKKMKIPLNGISFPVMHKLSKTAFDFGDCPVSDRRDLYFELKNENKLMSLKYKFGKIACFQISPVSGTLQPLQSTNILLTFLPKQMGKFKNVIMKLVFNNNPMTFCNLFLNGSSHQYLELDDTPKANSLRMTRNHFGLKTVGGTDKLPVDFKPIIKIIADNPDDSGMGNTKEITAIMKDTSNLEFDTEIPGQSAFYRPPWNSSVATTGLWPREQQTNVSIINAAKEDNSEPNLEYTFSNMDMTRRYLNTKKADHRLVAMRKKRKRLETMRKNPSKNDGNNVPPAKEDEDPEDDIERDVMDIGLINFQGLKEPKLDLPDADDSNRLYLGDGQVIEGPGDRLNFFKKCMITRYNKKGSIPKIDENKLIKNKFKSVPETSAEIIDCQTTLTRKELKELEYGPKVMNFGKICIHSEHAKNFSIINKVCYDNVSSNSRSR